MTKPWYERVPFRFWQVLDGTLHYLVRPQRAFCDWYENTVIGPPPVGGRKEEDS